MTAWMMAAETGSLPEWATWLGVPIWLGGAGVLIWLLLTRKVRTDAEVKEQLAAKDIECEAERQGWAHEKAALTERLAAVVADRDAWREAHTEEAAARRASEKAAAALMESTNISLALLQALRDAMTGRQT